MLGQRAQLRKVLGSAECTPGASIFDPLSARIADMLGWTICKLPGSTFKGGNLAVPDDSGLANLSDLVDVCRRISHVCDASLIVDADHGGGDPLNVRRTVRELEATGVAAIEIEDTRVQSGLGAGEARSDTIVSRLEQTQRLRAAAAARRDADTLIIARSRALAWLPREDALDRVRAYSDTGAEALMFPETRTGRADIEAVAKVTHLPLMLLRMPEDVWADAAFLQDTQVRVRFTEQVPYSMAVKAIHDGLLHLRNGGAAGDLAPERAGPELLQKVIRSEDFEAWRERFAKDP